MKTVWIADPDTAFIKAQLQDDGQVRKPDGSLVKLPKDEIFQVNPPQFDKADDIAELTFLNEASVVNNLSTRYAADNIYTYSGLFLVAVNPYKQLDIYGSESIKQFINKKRDESKPHIYAVAEAAFRQMLETRANQSILITGESGAGKTENTKKTIQYLSAVTSKQSTTEQRILQTNPVLEAFGNAQTVRNNNSSRFGKFIRIEFAKNSSICGASIDWYLLEKSRVLFQSDLERNYHIFYYLLAGADTSLRQKLALSSSDPKDYAYLSGGASTIDGVDDGQEFSTLIKALETVGFKQDEIHDIFLIVAAVLHLGNIEVTSMTTDQGRIPKIEQVRRVCKLLGVKEDVFAEILVKPKIKAGRELVAKANSADQIRHSINALAMALYERLFGHIVERLNTMLHPSHTLAAATFIGVLDIAGFEIFETNSFEQLCINYTNEKLQQFFNHHMFVLEQAEYVKEEIEWEYVDYGIDLQPTIDLIEKQMPMGIFAILDEDCVMPRTSDKSFTEKLASKWTNNNAKFKPSRLNQGFVVSHYAAQVEYSTDGWLEKNKDPLNDQITELLSQGTNKLVTSIFPSATSTTAGATTATTATGNSSPKKVRKGIFRTVAQRHKEQLTDLMTQLDATHPHFVRCIVPNQQKTPGKFDNKLVLDQLRCNGVLEGIRIARSGFPNRVEFTEFRQRYHALLEHVRQFTDNKSACEAILKSLQLNPSSFKIGTSKVFFKNGVLAELEEIREKLIVSQTLKVQAIAKGYLCRKAVQRQVFKNHSAKTLAVTARTWLKHRDDNWWKLYQNIRPLLTNAESKENNRKDVRIQRLEENLDKARNDYSVLEGRRSKLNKDLDELKQTKSSLESQVAEKAKIASSVQKQLKSLESQLQQQREDGKQELETLKQSHSTVVDKLQFDLKKTEKSLKEIDTKHTDLDKQHTNFKSQFNSLRKTHDTLKESHDKLQAQYTELDSNHKKLQTSHEEAAKHARASKAEVDRLNAERAELETDIKNLKANATHTTKELAIKSDTIARLETELPAAKAEILKLQAELALVDTLKTENESLKQQTDSSKTQFSARLNEYVQKLEVLEEENKKVKSQARNLQVEQSKFDKANNELDSLKNVLEKAGVAPGQLEGALKSAAVSHKALEELTLLKRTLQAAGIGADNLESQLSNMKKVEANSTKAIDSQKSIVIELEATKQQLVELEAMKKAQAKEVETMKRDLLKARKAAREAAEAEPVVDTTQIEILKKQLANARGDALKAQKESATAKQQVEDAKIAIASAKRAAATASESSKAVSALDKELDSCQRRNRELESELARIKQEYMEMKSAHANASEIARQLEKTQREKADMLAANSRLMFGMEQQRRSSRELESSSGSSSQTNSGGSASDALVKKLESELKVLKLKLLRSERERKVIISNGHGNNGDELLKEHDDAIRALERLKRENAQLHRKPVGAQPNIDTIEVRKQRRTPLRTLSGNEPSSPQKPQQQQQQQQRLSSSAKEAVIAELHDNLKEEKETMNMYRKRANDYQEKIEQAQVIMQNLKISEDSLLTEIEELKQKQLTQAQDKDKELGLKNETIRRLRKELDNLKGEYQQHVVVDSSTNRANTQAKMSELVASLNEVTSERDLLLADKMKLEKRLNYAWARDDDPVSSRKQELEQNLSQIRRDFSSAKHELSELRSKSDLNYSRCQQYQQQLEAAELKNQQQALELEKLRDEGFDNDLRLKQINRELGAMREENLRLEKYKSRYEKNSSGSVFI